MKTTRTIFLFLLVLVSLTSVLERRLFQNLFVFLFLFIVSSELISILVIIN